MRTKPGNIRRKWTLALAALLLACSLIPAGGLAATADAAAAIYEVGPGQAYANIGDVPFDRLRPGDTVRIHYRPEPYREIVLLSRSGTAEAPITIEGVPGPGGKLPKLDGNGAVVTPRMQTSYAGTVTRGLVIVALRPGDEWGYKPSHIVIQGLDLSGAHRDNTFTVQAAGEARRFANAAAGVFVERGEDITIRGNIVHDNGNGIFVATGTSEEMTSRNILIEGNTIYDNGIVGSDQQHNTYTEAARIVYQYNYFGPPKAGALGNALKDRSAGTIVRYNFFHRGAHALDLVEAEDGFPVLSQDPTYRKTYVYGNVILNDPGYSGSIVHYGGDLLESMYRKGTLYFYNNTVVIRNDQSRKWRTVLLHVERGNKVDFRNNIVHTSAETAGAKPTETTLMNEYGDVQFGKNWISSGYVLSRDYYQGSITGLDNLIAIPGNDPGFVDAAAGDFHLRAASGAIDLAEQVPGIPDELQVRNQFVNRPDALYGELRAQRGAALDFGALEYGPGGLPTVPEERFFYHPPAGSAEPTDDTPEGDTPDGGTQSDVTQGSSGHPGEPSAPPATLYTVFGSTSSFAFTPAGAGTAEKVTIGDAAGAKLAQFGSAWAVPKQIVLKEPVPLAKWDAQARLLFDVRLDGTATNTNPVTLLFYFNGAKDAQHWVGSASFKLGTATTLSLDLTSILGNLGGSISQIGVLSGYGWPADATLQLSNARIVGTGAAWSAPSGGGTQPPADPASPAPAPTEPAPPTPLPVLAAQTVTFTDSGKGAAETVALADGTTGYKLSGFPDTWAVPKQLTLAPGISLSDWQPGDRLELRVRYEGTPRNANPTTLLFYFNGNRDAQHWVGSEPLKLGQDQTVSLDLSKIVGNLGGSITQIGVLTGYGWPQDAAVTISGIRKAPQA